MSHRKRSAFPKKKGTSTTAILTETNKNGSRFASYVDGISEGGLISGWSIDLGHPEAPSYVSVYIDGALQQEVRCDIERQDVRRAGYPSENAGFQYQIDARYLDGHPHRLHLTNTGGEDLIFSGTSESERGSRWFCIAAPRQIDGAVDGFIKGAVRGWIHRVDPATGQRTGGVRVGIEIGNQIVKQIVANEVRPDVARATGGDSSCGFRFFPPHEWGDGQSRRIRILTLPDCVELSGSPMLFSVPTGPTEEQLRKIQARLRAAAAEIWSLQKQIDTFIPVPSTAIGNYESWAQDYFRDLGGRVRKARDQAHKPPIRGISVSLICIVDSPDPADLIAAIDSVIAQSHRNFELLLATIGSNNLRLEPVQKYLQTDSRIRLHILDKDLTLPQARNTMLARAGGEYVAFTGEADILCDVALEVMLTEAAKTQAKVLYSDEDEIDEGGNFSRVVLKPAWNYRLLLSTNFVGNLLLVHHDLVAAVGQVDGSSKEMYLHDYLLRISEVEPDNKIVHVPEILYHRRQAMRSGPVWKVGAGTDVAANVNTHYERKGILARAIAMDVGPVCRTVWQLDAEPSVAIIIPFRDQAQVTRRCVEGIISRTSYRNYRLVLVDNSSSSPEALKFIADMRNSAHVSVLSHPGAFNYSKINNMAAEKQQVEFLVFLNNDIMITDGSWLNALVGETMSNDRVAIVGSKLIYPDGKIQHAGVILSRNQIAEHAFRGLEKEAPGYEARALCAQEYSAVTAACMLVRKKVFSELGGFDEEHLQVAYSDIDLCLRARGAGYQVIYTPDCCCVHHESLSRGDDLANEHIMRFSSEYQFMVSQWGALLENDPFYNPNFSLDGEPFEQLRPMQSRLLRDLPYHEESALADAVDYGAHMRKRLK